MVIGTLYTCPECNRPAQDCMLDQPCTACQMNSFAPIDLDEVKMDPVPKWTTDLNEVPELRKRVEKLESDLISANGHIYFLKQEVEAWQVEFHRSERYRSVAQKEIRELEYMLNHINSFVMLGETDSIDSLRALFKELEELRAKK